MKAIWLDDAAAAAKAFVFPVDDPKVGGSYSATLLLLRRVATAGAIAEKTFFPGRLPSVSTLTGRAAKFSAVQQQQQRAGPLLLLDRASD